MKRLMKISMVLIAIMAMTLLISCEEESVRPMDTTVESNKKPPDSENTTTACTSGDLNLDGDYSFKSSSGWDGTLATFNGTTVPLNSGGVYCSTENYVGTGSGSVKAGFNSSSWSNARYICVESGDSVPYSWELDWCYKSTVAGSSYVTVSVFAGGYGHAKSSTFQSISANTWTEFSEDILPIIQDILDENNEYWADITSIVVAYNVYVPSPGPSTTDTTYLDGIQFTYTEQTATPTISGPSSIACYGSDDYSVQSTFGEYSWAISGACGSIYSGQGTDEVTVGSACTGTVTLKCKVKNTGEAWSEYATKTITIN